MAGDGPRMCSGCGRWRRDVFWWLMCEASHSDDTCWVSGACQQFAEGFPPCWQACERAWEKIAGGKL